MWLERRLSAVLPKVMREHGVEMWILAMREYAEDPVFFSLTSPTTFAARRRSIYVFHDQGPAKGVERLALGGGDQGGLYSIYRDPKPRVAGAELVGDDQWRLLRQLVEKANPRTIALNIDPVNAFADGLHAGEREALEKALGPRLMKRVVREPRLAVEYLGTRPPAMLPRYREVQETVHALIATAFSRTVIHPGETSTQDVEWWLRQRVQELGMTVWFHPDVERAAPGVDWGKGVIQRGDVLWVDFGVIAMNLHTDTQHLGYVLRPGETGPPPGLLACLATTNRLQDFRPRRDEARPHRQRGPEVGARRDVPSGDRRHHLLPPHRRPRPRRRPPHRPVGPAGGRPRPRRSRHPSEHLVLHRAPGHLAHPRMERPAPSLPAGGGRIWMRMEPRTGCTAARSGPTSCGKGDDATRRLRRAGARRRCGRGGSSDGRTS